MKNGVRIIDRYVNCTNTGVAGHWRNIILKFCYVSLFFNSRV